MIVSIHQPNFMPWLGFFSKIIKSDKFVILDHVENNPRDAQLWLRRVKMLISGHSKWISIPLVKDYDTINIPINEMKVNVGKRILEKQLKGIRYSYTNHPYYDEIYPLIDEYFQFKTDDLVLLNMEFIKKVIDKLNIETELIYSSELECQDSSNELLIEIIKKLDGDTYLAGDGADGYQDDDIFYSENISIIYNNFAHSTYEQRKSSSFISGLSIVDPLMNLGYVGTRELLT